jgi:hypothetical protein
MPTVLRRRSDQRRRLATPRRRRSAHFHHYFGAEVAARRWRSRQTRRARRAPTRIEPSGRIGGSPCSRRRPGRYFGVRLHSGPRTTSAERK